MQPATQMQLDRLRDLAAEPEISPAAREAVEQRIGAGLTVDQAYRLIRELGGRIADARWGE